MSVFKNIGSRVQALKEKTKGHHKWKMFLYAGIIVFVLFFTWLFGSKHRMAGSTKFYEIF